MAYDEYVLHDTIQAAAAAIAVAGIVMLLTAWTAEIVRRRHTNSRFVVIADRLVPGPLHRTAIATVSVIAGILSLMGGRPAAADESIRDWLSTPTSTAVRASTTTTLSGRSIDAPDPTPSTATTSARGCLPTC